MGIKSIALAASVLILSTGDGIVKRKIYSKTILLLLGSLALAACGGGGSSGNSSGDNSSTDITLSKSTLVYDRFPRLNEEFKISIEGNSLSSNSSYTWKVVTEPGLSALQLNEVDSGKSLFLTPIVAGNYKISVTSSNNESIETEFSVEKELPFNISKLEGYDGSQDVSEISGIIKNQVWVYSRTLSSIDIESTVYKYPDFIIIGFDEIRGLLVEFDESKSSVIEDIEKLKLEKGVDSVVYRVHEGSNIGNRGLKTPNDGSSFFDYGDNWHLEYIEMRSAWDITTGNDEFYIGITDGTFGTYHTKHEDLIGRFKEAINSSNGNFETHGTGVAGTIGAITDNKKGMSGINWISQMIGGIELYQGLKEIIKKDKVPLVNNSWTMTDYLPDDFDLTKTQKTSAWVITARSRTRDYRRLADDESNKDKLFVWAAGNGVGNGVGYKGYYGVDGMYHNPALHYNDHGILQKIDNVLFVAAVLNDNRLAYFSEHGESVDIAAPTKFKATKDNDIFFDDYYEGASYGANTSGGFSGTSAAAPVVTGVASLIFSLDQEFKASDVKSILINSAKVYAKERYKAPGNAGDNDSNIKPLTHYIPILNASSALQMAKDIKEGKIAKVEHTFPDAFQPEVKVQISSANNKLTTKKFDYILGVNTANIDEVALYQDIYSGDVNSNFVLISLDPERVNYSVRGNTGVDFTHEKTEITSTAEYIYDFNVLHIKAVVQDTVSLAAIPNVSIEVQSMTSSVGLSYPQGTGFSDSDGSARLYLLPGDYKIFAKVDGYKDFSKIIHIQDVAQPVSIKITMTSNQAGQVGSIGGVVYDESGSPLKGALVRVSGGEQTNGFFTSAITDDSGMFQLSNISKVDSTGKPIITFILSASASSYAESIKEGVIVISGSSVNHNFTLIKQDLSGSGGDVGVVTFTGSDVSYLRGGSGVFTATKFTEGSGPDRIWEDENGNQIVIETYYINSSELAYSAYVSNPGIGSWHAGGPVPVEGITISDEGVFTLTNVSFNVGGLFGSDASDTLLLGNGTLKRPQSNPETPAGYLEFIEGNPGVEGDGLFISSTPVINDLAPSLNGFDSSFTVFPKLLVDPDGITITTVTKLPKDDVYHRIFYEFGYLGTECLIQVNHYGLIVPYSITADASYYSSRSLALITDFVRSGSTDGSATITSGIGCSSAEVSRMFFNRIVFDRAISSKEDLESPDELDAAIMESGFVNRFPNPSLSQ